MSPLVYLFGVPMRFPSACLYSLVHSFQTLMDFEKKKKRAVTLVHSTLTFEKFFIKSTGKA